ncbi:MAG: hypothetical protein KJZ93_14835 [Caldilineaceae bacterium]|nr:hypothetical protein [Caldilineaceae bacterium]
MTTAATGGLTANTYRSYLVRFWQSNEQGCWRASAQCVQSGNTVLFGDVANLVAFLQTEIQRNSSEVESRTAEQAT